MRRFGVEGGVREELSPCTASPSKAKVRAQDANRRNARMRCLQRIHATHHEVRRLGPLHAHVHRSLLRLKCVLCQSTTHPRFRLRTASARSTPRDKHRSVDGAGLRVHVERRIDSFELTMVATTTRGAVNASPCAQSAKPSPLPPPLSRLSHPPLTEGVSRARTAATRKECVLGACARKRERRVNSNVKAFGCCPSAR